MIFINGLYSKTDLLDSSENVHNSIENSIIGMIVLKPTRTVGRILINPKKINITQAFIKTTRFEISVLGLLYQIEAFPASGQDKEVMTCAEVNIWQIMEFFGKKYDHYKTLLPSELLSLTKENSDVRVLPSEGLTDEQESFLFLRSGFAPKIYYKLVEREFHDEVRLYEEYSDPAFESILHLYIASGIPVLINLSSKDDGSWEGHSITCIGYVNNDINEQKGIIKKRIDKIDAMQYDGISVIETWAQKFKYVFIEDHTNPIFTSYLSDLCFPELQGNWKVENFVVPLYKHIFVSAEEACIITERIIAQTSDVVKEVINGNDLVLKIFLIASRDYKEYRISHTNNINEKIFLLPNKLSKIFMGNRVFYKRIYKKG